MMWLGMAESAGERAVRAVANSAAMVEEVLRGFVGVEAGRMGVMGAVSRRRPARVSSRSCERV